MKSILRGFSAIRENANTKAPEEAAGRVTRARDDRTGAGGTAGSLQQVSRGLAVALAAAQPYLSLPMNLNFFHYDIRFKMLDNI